MRRPQARDAGRAGSAFVLLSLVLSVVACGSRAGTRTPPVRPPLAHRVPAPLTEAASIPVLTQLPVLQQPDRAVSARARAAAYAGVWIGETRRRACTEFGGAVGVACRSLPAGQPVVVQLTGEGPQVRGVLTLGTERIPVIGRATPDGTLVLDGEHVGSSHTLTLQRWRARLEESRLRGTFSYRIAPADEGLGTVLMTAALHARMPAQ